MSKGARHWGSGPKHNSSGLDDSEKFVDEDDPDQPLSVWDAADIWLSSGKDEDYTFGYSVEELEAALDD